MFHGSKGTTFLFNHQILIQNLYFIHIHDKYKQKTEKKRKDGRKMLK